MFCSQHAPFRVNYPVLNTGTDATLRTLSNQSINIFRIIPNIRQKIAPQLRQPIYRNLFSAITEAKRSDDVLIDTIYRKKFG